MILHRASAAVEPALSDSAPMIRDDWVVALLIAVFVVAVLLGLFGEPRVPLVRPWVL